MRLAQFCLVSGLVACVPLGVFGQARHILKGNVHPLAEPRFDQGRVEPSTRMPEMMLALQPRSGQDGALDQLLDDLQNPGSPLYHQWLTPEQFGDRFGASQQDINRVTAWLQSSGFTVSQVARGNDYIVFTGTAAQVENAMGTEIHRYKVRGELHYANASEPSLPLDVAGVVAGIMGLDDFRPEPRPRARNTRMPANSTARPEFVNSEFPGFTILAPDDLATIYNVNALYNRGFDGTGQKIVVAGASDINLADIQAFRWMFNLPQNDPVKMLVPGSRNPGQGRAEVEADLDLEWAGAIARNATLLYVYSESPMLSAIYAIDNALAPVVTYSFGECELRMSANGRDFVASEAKKGAAIGITWVAASGDSGAAGCEDQNGGFNSAITRMNVNIPASMPEVTGVGGLEFKEGNGTYFASQPGINNGSALSYIPETGWTDESSLLTLGLPGFESSGGGASLYINKPSWQKGPGVPNDGVRDVPDVALTASGVHDPYALISGGQSLFEGGTSAAAPSFAGIVALLNQYVASTGTQKQPGLGNINPMLYNLAQSAPTAFHDIVAGDNLVPCVPKSTQDCTNGSMGYKAGPGYDLVTGLGSVDAYNLAVAWAGPTPAKPSLVITDFTASTSVSAGGSFTLSLTVANKGGADAGAFRMGAYFTINGDISTTPQGYNVGCNINALAAGQTTTCSGTLNLDPIITSGTYDLIGVADLKSQVQAYNHPGNTALVSSGPLTVN